MTRPPPEDRPSAGQLAGGASGGSLECPSCGCRQFKTYGTIPQSTGSVRRYLECRNASCGKKWVTFQSPPKIIREVETRDDEPTVLKVRMA